MEDLNGWKIEKNEWFLAYHSTKDKMAAIIHTSNWSLEMTEKTVISIMLLNKLWIPDVLIDLIKDYLYISVYTVWQNFYRLSINRSITSLTIKTIDMFDIFGRKRITHWQIGHVYTESEIELQNTICTTCCEGKDRHENVNGCCALEWDGEDGSLELSEKENPNLEDE